MCRLVEEDHGRFGRGLNGIEQLVHVWEKRKDPHKNRHVDTLDRH
jgi:hypothetical protein